MTCHESKHKPFQVSICTLQTHTVCTPGHRTYVPYTWSRDGLLIVPPPVRRAQCGSYATISWPHARVAHPHPHPHPGPPSTTRTHISPLQGVVNQQQVSEGARRPPSHLAARRVHLLLFFCLSVVCTDTAHFSLPRSTRGPSSTPRSFAVCSKLKSSCMCK
jgi:hypothetical protein